MTDCERSETLFGRAWDDELTVAEKDGLERHFAACSPCRREYDELARTLELVQALPRPQVDDSFAGRVLAAAQERERTTAAAGRRLFALPAFGRQALALAATFVVAAGIGAFLMARPVVGPSSPVLESPAVATTTTPSRVTVPTPSAAPEGVLVRVADPSPARITPARRRAPAAAAAAAPPTTPGTLA
ncbi:MAG: zf-HC2 domain-containing protein, partial [Candidatus Eisenbacteria bacterium]